MNKLFGFVLVRIGKGLQGVGQDGIKQREWYEYKSFAAKSVGFVFDTIFLLLFYSLYRWIAAQFGHLHDYRLPLFLFTLAWYVYPLIKRWFRKKRYDFKQPAVSA